MSRDKYKKEMEEMMAQKEEIINELRNDLEKKQSDLERLEDKYDNETGTLNR